MTGNLINRLMERSKQPEPVVGMAATICHYSDRSPATVTKVSPSGKTIWLREDDAVRVDKNGMSESQTYTYTPSASNPEYRATLTKKGWKIARGSPVMLGRREKYHDFSF